MRPVIELIDTERESRLLARLSVGPQRRPHHSSSEASLIAELALAVGGTVVISEPDEHRAGALAEMLTVWARMPHRPKLVVVGDLDRGVRYVLWKAMDRAYQTDGERAPDSLDVRRAHLDTAREGLESALRDSFREPSVDCDEASCKAEEAITSIRTLLEVERAYALEEARALG